MSAFTRALEWWDRLPFWLVVGILFCFATATDNCRGRLTQKAKEPGANPALDSPQQP